MKKYTYVPGAFIAVWLIWELVVRIGGFNEALLPTPYKVLLGFGELIGDGVLFKDIADSLVRFFIGYIISVVAGVFLGLILGWYKGIWNYINPIVQVIRPISPTRLSRSVLGYRPSPCHCYHLYCGVFPGSIVHGVRDSKYRSRIHQGGSKFWYQAAGIVI